MTTNDLSRFVQTIREAAMQYEHASLTDGQLLERYIHDQEAEAFAVLVHRHGPMIWGVCRRVLRSHEDAEDAFQATFLVLVRKAASVRSRDLVGNWLYGVAHQTALKARATTAKRRAREKQVAAMPEPAVEQHEPCDEQQPLLDQELAHLPDKYRTVIVLCDLEGKTRKEAAVQLKIPEGTVASRLATARAMLAKRLARRGLSLSDAALATALAKCDARELADLGSHVNIQGRNSLGGRRRSLDQRWCSCKGRAEHHVGRKAQENRSSSGVVGRPRCKYGHGDATNAGGQTGPTSASRTTAGRITARQAGPAPTPARGNHRGLGESLGRSPLDAAIPG